MAYSPKDCVNQATGGIQGSGLTFQGFVGSSADQCGKLDTKRQPEMGMALDSLEQRLSVLEKEQSELKQRLSVILRNEPAQTQVPSPPEYSGCTHLTSAIAQATNRINGLICQTRTMLDLLEL